VTAAAARRALAHALGPRRATPRVLLLLSLGVGLLALVTLLLYVADDAPDLYTARQPGIRMARRYAAAARAILDGDGILYPRARPSPSDTGLLSRPPGYPAFVAATYALLGRGFRNVQLAQAFFAALLPGAVLWLGARVVGLRAGIAAGLVAALSPMLGYHAVSVTPDGLASLLVVLTMPVLWRERRRLGPGLVAVGALTGLATWLRPNFLLLTPLLVALLPVAVGRPGRTWRRGLAAVAVAVLIVLPITVRNARLYGALVPVSINGGIVLWEGIADAGGERFGARRRDLEVAREEARTFGEPDHSRWWASPDGIERDRRRIRRSLEVIAGNPAWYAGSVSRRALRILNLERAEAPLVERPPDARGSAPSSGGPLVAGGRAEPFRGSIGLLQRVATAPALPLRILGLVALVVLSLRRTLFLLLLPLSVLIMQAPVHFEPRYAMPLYALYPLFEGVAWALLLRSGIRAVRFLRPAAAGDRTDGRTASVTR
jgi:Dolichyl-phosphate-mannose-protein mannosyltransferase